ncbi:xanthine dehydrogenase family protein molybdopterin-binding subunit [Sulfitobacter sp. 1A12126]|uniref:xanthine dehydrogenase family protein molybdopterin-binding subunit n=1 Tax=Sulfitobacter sp. 1A12126 TaxID=3368591 RepID=UPI0037473228
MTADGLRTGAHHVGTPLRRENARRHAAGRSRFTTDLTLPRMLHAAFVRSPLAHGRITELDVSEARAAPGVHAVLTAEDLKNCCTPWRGTLDHFAGMSSVSQRPLAEEEVLWVGHPVAVILAESRAMAEDASELVFLEIEELPAVADPHAALHPDSPKAALDAEKGNLCFETMLETDAVDQVFAEAALVVKEEFTFGRHTAVTLEPRAILADFDPSTRRLTVHQGTQTPYQFQDAFARHLGLEQSNVRVISPDVGGSFGMKLHVYHEEMAVAAASVLHGRPVRYVPDRLETFLSDIHARDHRVTARMALDAEGHILAMDVHDIAPIGPFSTYPRTSVAEGNQVVRLMGAPYRMPDYRGRLQVVFQNKVQTSQYRAVGHPIACAVTEALVDKAAVALQVDPFAIRAANVIRDDAYPARSATGFEFESLSHEECLGKLRALMGYDALRNEQGALRAKGIHRGIGIAPFVEITNPGAAFYGIGGARISAQDGAIVKLTPGGQAQVAISVTEQGQGTETIIAQIVADELGLNPAQVRVTTGDTETTPSGGATWACRGAGIGGETALRAARKLADQIKVICGAVLQKDSASLRLSGGAVTSIDDPMVGMDLSEVARIAYYRPDTLPAGIDTSLSVAHHFAPSGYPFDFTNGIQASYVEVDTETGIVRLLRHWVVEDCGRIINPLLVDEQIRGGVVQGLGAAFFEECLYDEGGQLTNGSMADYLVPMPCEMPDILIAHVETPTRDTILGAKGVGEAGTAAASAAAMNAVNDALRPLGARITQTPMTPLRILRALKTITD